MNTAKFAGMFGIAMLASFGAAAEPVTNLKSEADKCFFGVLEELNDNSWQRFLEKEDQNQAVQDNYTPDMLWLAGKTCENQTGTELTDIGENLINKGFSVTFFPK